MPDMPSILPAVLVAAVFVLTGFVKGVTGLGLPTVAIGLPGLAMPVAEAGPVLQGPLRL